MFALDFVRERLDLAQKLGATPIDAAVDPAETVRQATHGRGADCALEAVGHPSASRLAFDVVRPGGTIAACGVHTEAHFAFSPGEAYDKNLTYRAGRCPVRSHIEQAFDIAREADEQLASIISHRVSLEEGPRAYEMFDEKLEGCSKVLLVP